MLAGTAKVVWDEAKKKRLTFHFEWGKPGFWWNYCDLDRRGEDYQRCSDGTFPTLTEAEIDAYRVWGM